MKFKNRIEDEENEDFSRGNLPYVTIEARTWYRDSHGLYDYDSQNVVKTKINLYRSWFLNKSNDDHVELSIDDINKDLELASIVCIKGRYFMSNENGYMWRVLNSK